jgi:hypothetical protein
MSNYAKGQRVWYTTMDGHVGSGTYQSSFRMLGDPTVHIIATTNQAGEARLHYVEAERLFDSFTKAHESIGGPIDLEADTHPC